MHLGREQPRGFECGFEPGSRHGLDVPGKVDEFRETSRRALLPRKDGRLGKLLHGEFRGPALELSDEFSLPTQCRQAIRAAALVMPHGGSNRLVYASGHAPFKNQFVDEVVEIGRRFDIVDLVCNVVEPHPFHPSADISPPVRRGRLKRCEGFRQPLAGLVVCRSRDVQRALRVADGPLGGLDGSEGRFNGLDLRLPVSSRGAQGRECGIGTGRLDGFNGRELETVRGVQSGGERRRIRRPRSAPSAAVAARLRLPT